MVPLRMSLWERARQGHPVQPRQLRAHSDAGSQYTAVTYTEKLALDGIAPSIGSVGDAYDTQSIMCPGWQIVSLTRVTTGGRVNGSDPSYDWRPRPANALICRPIGLLPAHAIVSHMS